MNKIFIERNGFCFNSYCLKPLLRKTIFVCIVVFIPTVAIADGDKGWEQLLDHELKVVLNNRSEEFNKCLKEAVEKNWKLSKFSFVDGHEETKLMEANADVPFMSIMTDETYDYHAGGTTKETVLRVYYYSSKNRYSSFARVKINNFRLTLDVPLLMTYAVKALNSQGVLKTTFVTNKAKMSKEKEKNFSGMDFERARKKWKEHTLNKIKKDTLFVCPDYLDPEIATEAKFKEVFPYPFRFITEKEVFDIITNGRPKGYLLLIQKSPSDKEQYDLVFETSYRFSVAKYSYHFLINANLMTVVGENKVGYMSDNKDKLTKKYLRKMLDTENMYSDLTYDEKAGIK